MTTHAKRGLTLLALGVGLSTACTTTSGPEYTDSWDNLRGAVVSSLPQGLTATSINGRTFTSGYYDPQNIFKDGTKLRERAQATVTILGPSRPYHLDINVEIYKRAKDGEYDDDGSDEKLAEDLVLRIQKDLAHRRKGRDVIDDFQAF